MRAAGEGGEGRELILLERRFKGSDRHGVLKVETTTGSDLPSVTRKADIIKYTVQ